jgi:hypothetical protein
MSTSLDRQPDNDRDRVKCVVSIRRLGAPDGDVEYWLKQPPSERIRALEQIRKEYHRWKFGAEPRLQRVYRVVPLQ